MNAYEEISRSARALGKCFPRSFRVEFSEYDGLKFITVNVNKWRFGSPNVHLLHGNARVVYDNFCQLCDRLSEAREEPDEVTVIWDFPDFHVFIDTAAIG